MSLAAARLKSLSYFRTLPQGTLKRAGRLSTGISLAPVWCEGDMDLNRDKNVPGLQPALEVTDLASVLSLLLPAVESESIV